MKNNICKYYWQQYTMKESNTDQIWIIMKICSICNIYMKECKYQLWTTVTICNTGNLLNTKKCNSYMDKSETLQYWQQIHSKEYSQTSPIWTKVKFWKLYCLVKHIQRNQKGNRKFEFGNETANPQDKIIKCIAMFNIQYCIDQFSMSLEVWQSEF